MRYMVESQCNKEGRCGGDCCFVEIREGGCSKCAGLHLARPHHKHLVLPLEAGSREKLHSARQRESASHTGVGCGNAPELRVGRLTRKIGQ
eukprot:scaffold322715_cov32-Tisochrysis_lutea.AAC.3